MEFLFSFIFVLFGLAPIVLAIVLLVRIGELSRRVRKLESLLAGPPEPPQPASPAVPVAPPAPPLPPPLSPPPSRKKGELEAVIGGTVMNRIGALALVFGVGFFLKYAFDNDWITETMRVLIGIMTGLLCLAGGYRSHTRRYKIFAQGLVGAGISILYLSLYASFNFYHLIPQWIAFLLMSGVTVLALGLSVYYDSLATSLLGWAGGFLTPFLLSTGESNEIALFTYIALLAVSLAGITLRNERWYVLEPLTLAGVFIVYFSWYEEYYMSNDLWVTLFFLALFWLLFMGTDLARGRLGLLRFAVFRHVTQTANAALTYTALAIMISHYPDTLGSATFALGILYAATLVLAERLPLTSSPDSQSRNGLLAAAFLLIGTGIEFGDHATIRLWALQGLLLLWLGLHTGRSIWNYSGLVFLAASAGKFLVTEGSLAFTPLEGFTVLMNDRGFSAATVALSLGAGALIAARFRDSFAQRVRPWLGVACFLMLLILFTAETNDWFRKVLSDVRQEQTGDDLRESTSRIHNERQLAISALWLVYSAIVLGIGLLRKAAGPRFFAIGLFALTILKIFVFDLSFLETLYRIFSFVGLGIILLAMSFWYQRYRTVLFSSEEKENQ